MPHDSGQDLFIFFAALYRCWLVFAIEFLGHNEGKGDASSPGSGSAPYPVGVGGRGCREVKVYYCRNIFEVNAYTTS
jgi:hypothetical protein